MRSAAAQAGGDLLPCIQSLAFALPSASVISDDLLSVCSEPGMGDVSGCSDCTSAANCPDPLSECMLLYAGRTMLMSACHGVQALICQCQAVPPTGGGIRTFCKQYFGSDLCILLICPAQAP